MDQWLCGYKRQGVASETQADPVSRPGGEAWRGGARRSAPSAPLLVDQVSVEQTLNATAMEQLRRAAQPREIDYYERQHIVRRMQRRTPSPTYASRAAPSAIAKPRRRRRQQVTRGGVDRLPE